MLSLNILEAQLGVVPTTGNSLYPPPSCLGPNPLDNLSFTIVLELNDNSQPSASQGKVTKLEPEGVPPLALFKGPPCCFPAVAVHATSATSDRIEIHLVRIVNTGIIDVSFHFRRFQNPLLKV